MNLGIEKSNKYRVETWISLAVIVATGFQFLETYFYGYLGVDIFAVISGYVYKFLII